MPKHHESAQIECRWHRRFGPMSEGEPQYTQAPWLVTLDIARQHARDALTACMPQSRAVIDDFGTLVCVRDWL